MIETKVIGTKKKQKKKNRKITEHEFLSFFVRLIHAFLSEVSQFDFESAPVSTKKYLGPNKRADW